MNDAALLAKKNDAAKIDGFKHWLGMTSTRALVSLMPASEHTETVLRVAFEAGHDAGQGAFAMTMIESMLKTDRKPSRDIN